MGETLQQCLDPEMLLPRLLRGFDVSGTICLRFIDPYGDTVFNSRQVTVLLGELTGLRPQLDDKTRQFVDSIIELGKAVEAEPHLYLKFEGD